MTRLRFAVLSIWTFGLAALLVAGRYPLFIRAGLWPLLLGTVVIFGLFMLAMAARRGGAGRPASAAAWVRSAMLVLPLAYMLPLTVGVSAGGLNHFALQKRSLGMGAGPDATDSPGDTVGPVAAAAVPTDQAVSIRAILMKFHRYEGRPVVIEGRAYRDETMPPGEMGLFRFVIVCCAADAMPAQVMVRSAEVSKYKDDDWVRVAGTVTSTHVDGNFVPLIDAAHVELIPAPANPYASVYK